MSFRLTCFLFACVSLGFAAYGSLVPLDLHRVPLDEAWRQFRHMALAPWSQASKTDALSNVLLFVPFGFFLGGAIARRSRRLALAAIPVVTLLALAASLAIEFSQIF